MNLINKLKREVRDHEYSDFKNIFYRFNRMSYDVEKSYSKMQPQL
jgi:hypothetical protein